jgi:tricorn protease
MPVNDAAGTPVLQETKIARIMLLSRPRPATAVRRSIQNRNESSGDGNRDPAAFRSVFMAKQRSMSSLTVWLTLLVAAPLLYPGGARAETRLLRHPTYSNGKVAFSYLGSLWSANDDGTGVQRLTVNKARDIYPSFSPDGKSIAFSSNRAGNYDVYVMPAGGDKPRQLTFNSADDVVIGWTPDGSKIIFISSRDEGVFPGVATLFQVPVNGGMEEPLPTDWGSWASYSPDGKKLAFTRHPGVWSRKHYRGSYAVDLWLMDTASREFTRLGDRDYKGNYFWPMYGNDGSIYFVADRLSDEKNIKYGSPEVMKSVNNIWKISENGGEPVQVTHHTQGNLLFPSISADRRTIVYEQDHVLWKLDVESGKSKQIPIDIKADTKENEQELRTIEGEAESFSLSPSGRRAAVAIHGEIFTIATERGEVQRVTETPWREQSPRWSPDGKLIAFVSDRTGREEIWVADELGHGLKQVTDVDCDKSSVTWSPDSKWLLWSGSDHKLWHVEVESLKTESLASSDVAAIGTPQFSPDGKWVSYSKEDTGLRPHVYVKPLSGGEEHVIEAEDFLLSYGAKWSPDGKTLLLLGGLGAPGMSSLNRTTTQLYSVQLTRNTNNPDDRGVDTEAEAEARAGRLTRGIFGGMGADRGAKPDIKIEWDGLERRIRQLTRLEAGSVMAVAPSPDSRTYAFVAAGGGADEFSSGAPALYIIADDGSKLTRLTGGPAADSTRSRRGGGVGEPQWSRDGHSIFFMQGSGIYTVASRSGPSDASESSGSAHGGPAAAPAADAGASPRRIDFTVRLEIDLPAERRQVFDEAWRVMRNRFYDPTMHGVDWDAAKKAYEPLLAYVGDSDELHSVIMEMIGELNASHTGIMGGDDPEASADRIQTRYPGFDLEPDAAAGYYKVASIDRKGPADHDYVKLSAGNYILSVNGRGLSAGDNYWKLFNLVSGRKFEFLVNSKPQADGAWTVGLEPLTAAAKSDLDYDRWVDSRRAMVDKLSDGQAGYLHIRAMDARSYTKFERDLLDNLGKKALIIDERFNGGGGIDQELLEILNQRKKYESWRGRNSVEVPRPVQAFFGPMVVLQNERSASNAEMFPEGFRTLGLGKVIGMPTYGAVIGTGSYRLMDGSSLRTPQVGVFTAKGVSLENYGVQPDVTVDNTPADFLAGHDRQIERALEVLGMRAPEHEESGDKTP